VSTAINRRDFLLLRVGGDDVAELSCERLFMRFVDAAAEGHTARLFEVLTADLLRTRVVRLTDVSWLAREDLKAPLEAVLGTFRAGGGRVISDSASKHEEHPRRQG
jgi:hypothetical protein